MQDHSLHPQNHEKTIGRPPIINSGGFSGARLARMHAAMRRHVERGLMPGLVTLVHHRGREYVEAIGAMILVEECNLRLDDPVDEWQNIAESSQKPPKVHDTKSRRCFYQSRFLSWE